MGQAGKLLVAWRDCRPEQGGPRCPGVISEASNSHREVFSGGSIVSLHAF